MNTCIVEVDAERLSVKIFDTAVTYAFIRAVHSMDSGVETSITVSIDGDGRPYHSVGVWIPSDKVRAELLHPAQNPSKIG